MIDKEELAFYNLLFAAFVGGGFILISAIIFAVVNNSTKMSRYISDHKCVVTETEIMSYMQPAIVGNMVTAFPMSKKYRHYHCEIDGERGTSFWH